jgi:hypothetical protein
MAIFDVFKQPNSRSMHLLHFTIVPNLSMAEVHTHTIAIALHSVEILFVSKEVGSRFDPPNAARILRFQRWQDITPGSQDRNNHNNRVSWTEV